MMTFKKQHFEMSEKLQFEIDFYISYNLHHFLRILRILFSFFDISFVLLVLFCFELYL